MSAPPVTASKTHKDDTRCHRFGYRQKVYASLWSALAALIAAFIVFSPVMFRVTSFLGTATQLQGAAFGYAPTWVGWLVHTVVAAAVTVGFALLFMQPWKKPVDMCPVNHHSKKK